MILPEAQRAECRVRCQQLLERMALNSVAVLMAASEVLRNRDSHYPFRQHSSFFYLTGFNEPDALLVLVKNADATTQVILFCAALDEEKARWQGAMLGPQQALQSLAIDLAHDLASVDQHLPILLENRTSLYVDFGQNPTFDQRWMSWLKTVRAKVRSGTRAPEMMQALSPVLDELRLIKSDFEIGQMQQAADIAAVAHQRAMRVCRPGVYEYQLEAELLHEFYRQGARAPAYSSIVGGGANACVLHYTDNSSVLRDGDLVLIDAGAEFGCYASDITRTFPVNGRFNDPQRELYNCVLQAQLAVIALIKPGVVWDDLHQCAIRQLTMGLLQLGLLQGDLESCIQSQAYKRFYMHNTGHWLGLDVHDVGAYKLPNAQGQLQWRTLQPGMVLTVEPGLYISAEADVNPRYHHMGIRIEDDVLVTATGARVLTQAVPKTVAEIESCMAAVHAAT